MSFFICKWKLAAQTALPLALLVDGRLGAPASSTYIRAGAEYWLGLRLDLPLPSSISSLKYYNPLVCSK